MLCLWVLRTNSTFASLCDILERKCCVLLMFIDSLHELASCPWIWNCSEMLCLRDIFNGAIESVDCTVGEYVFISHIFKSDFPAKKKSSNSHSTSPVSTDSVRSQRATQHHRKKETLCRVLGGKSFFLVIGHEDYFRKSDPWAVVE